MRESENGTAGRQRDRKERNRRIAAAVVMVALVSLATPACSSRNAELPAAGPEPEDIFAENVSGEVPGWIAYRDRSEIVAVDTADPTKTISLVTVEDRALIDWSRDGTRLLLQGQVQEGRYMMDALYIMNADGSETRLTGQGLYILGGSFSPDGSMVAYSTDDGISVIEAEGGTPRLVAASDPSTMTWLQDPAWSPDGSRIAFVTYGELRRDYAISVMNADGTGRRRLINLGARNPWGLAWLPEGAPIVSP
jgi:Tol biopolymer transport system component